MPWHQEPKKDVILSLIHIFYGIKHNNIDKMAGLKEMITIRKDKAYGKQNDYFDNTNCIGWTRAVSYTHL